jgi:hypothetical protein
MERKCKYCEDNIDHKSDTAKFCTRVCKEQYRCMIIRQNTKLKSLNLKNNNMTKENFITQKLDSYNFKKNAIYSSMKISEILKIMNTDTNGNLKSALSKSTKWQNIYGRTWKFVGETNNAPIVKESAPVIKQTAPVVKETAPIKEVGLIRKFIKWIY